MSCHESRVEVFQSFCQSDLDLGPEIVSLLAKQRRLSIHALVELTFRANGISFFESKLKFYNPSYELIKDSLNEIWCLVVQAIVLEFLSTTCEHHKCTYWAQGKSH